jgi:hypothetical protein
MRKKNKMIFHYILKVYFSTMDVMYYQCPRHELIVDLGLYDRIIVCQRNFVM